MKAVLIKTNNDVSVVDFTFDEIRAHLKGDVEFVRPIGLDRSFAMLVDEEGLLKELDLNFVGSILYDTPRHGNPIVGDVFIVKNLDTDFGSLSEEEAEKLVHDFKQIISDNTHARGVKYENSPNL
jgi:hypothetical protein